MSAVGGIAGAIAGIVGTTVNAIQTDVQGKKNRKAQHMENALSRQFALDMYNRDNEYNTPTMQMQRLRDAGINPHLAYQNGSPFNQSHGAVSPSGISALPPAAAPQLDVHALMNIPKAIAEIENIKANTDKTRAETENTLVIGDMNKTTLENMPTAINLDNAIKRSTEAVNLSRVAVDKVEVSKKEQEIVNLVTTDKVLNQQFNNLVKQGNLTDMQIKAVVSTIAVAQATIGKIRAETDLIKQKEKTESFIRNNLGSQTYLNNQKAATEGVVRSHLRQETLNKGEVFKNLARGNYIGEKFDLSMANEKLKQSYSTGRMLENQILGTMYDNEIKRLNIDYKTLENAYYTVDGTLNSVENALDVVNPMQTNTTSHTNTFDSKGNFKGSRSTKTSSKKRRK